MIDDIIFPKHIVSTRDTLYNHRINKIKNQILMDKNIT